MKPPIPEDLTPEQQRALSRWHLKKWPAPQWFRIESDRANFLRREVDQCLDWHRKKGRDDVKDWTAACRMWIRRSMDGFEERRPPSSNPKQAHMPDRMSTRPMEPIQSGLWDWR